MKSLNRTEICDLMGLDAAGNIPTLPQTFLSSVLQTIAHEFAPLLKDLVGQLLPELISKISESVKDAVVPSIRESVTRELLPKVDRVLREVMQASLKGTPTSSFPSSSSTVLGSSQEHSVVVEGEGCR